MEALKGEYRGRNERWSESIAVGSAAFVIRVQQELGIKAGDREIVHVDDLCLLKEAPRAYKAGSEYKNGLLSLENSILIDEYA